MSDPAFSAPADWFDGTSALRYEGTARWSPPGSLLLESDGRTVLEIPLSDLRFGDQTRERRTYTRASAPDFRLRLPRELPPGLASQLPSARVYGGWIDPIGLGRASIAFALVSAAVVALFMTAPQWLGPMIPFSVEQRIGNAMVGDLGNRLCSTPASDAAIAKLMRQVAPGETRIQTGIANIDMVNAAALPGGRVLLFDGLIEQARTPDELAGVLAHEVGHVQKRHVMTALLRQFGVTVLLSGASSGAADVAFGLASMGYTRSAEREADAEGRQALARANISPLGAAGFFDRMAAEEDDAPAGDAARRGAKGETAADTGTEVKKDEDDSEAMTSWLASHPSSRERATIYRADAKPGHVYTPALTEREFAALKTACRDDKDVEDFVFF